MCSGIIHSQGYALLLFIWTRAESVHALKEVYVTGSKICSKRNDCQQYIFLTATKICSIRNDCSRSDSDTLESEPDPCQARKDSRYLKALELHHQSGPMSNQL